MYSILLVDDEVAMRQTLKTITPWQEYGFVVVAESDNGREALEKLEEDIPDVIITDIRMPYMDGIEFIQKVREHYPTIQLIILSGYDEFSYAQAAVRYDVAEYVLKPVSVENMKEILSRTKKRLDEEIASAHDKARLNAFYNQALPVLKEKHLISLLTSIQTLNHEMLLAKAREYQLNLEGNSYFVAVVERKKSTSLDIIAMLENIESCLEKSEDRPIVFQYENQVILIFTSPATKEFEQLFKKQVFRALGVLLTQLSRFLPDKPTIGVGTLEHELPKLTVSYSSALSALSYASLYPDQHIISITDVELPQQDRDEFSDSGKLKAEFIHSVKFGTEKNIEDIIKETFSSPSAIRNYQVSVLIIVYALTEIISSYREDEIQKGILSQLSSLNTLSQAQEWCLKTSIEVHKKISGERENSHIQFVEKAKSIIFENFSNPLFGLEELCEAISVSPAYFSTTFKKETGLSFVQYLTNTRLEKAKELLRNSDDKTYAIAEMVGFSEQNYFSFCFKRNLGLSPSQYRQSSRK